MIYILQILWDEKETLRYPVMNCDVITVPRARSFGLHEMHLEDAPRIDLFLDFLKGLGLED